jgi:hypothetical protein
MLEQFVLLHLQELQRNICSNKTGHFQIGVLYEIFPWYMFSWVLDYLKLPVPWPQRSPGCQVHKNGVEFRVQSEVQSHVQEGSLLVQGKIIQAFTHLYCTSTKWFKM